MITASPVLDTLLADLLADLAARGIRLHVRDGRLRCEAPRGALTDELKQQLGAHKPALLARLGAASAAPVPLSYAQHRLWVVAQAEASAAYHMRIALRVTGMLDAGALEAAIQAVVERHGALRTAFVAHDDGAVQVVHPAVAVALARHDLRGLPAAHQRARLDAIMTEAAQQPFELSHPPLLRAAAVQLSELEHVVVIVVHHLVSDGASLGIFVAEIGELYSARVQGRAARLPELAVQYTDFAAWQREQLDGERLAELEAYWRAELDGAPPCLELPTDRPRSHAAAAGAVEDFVIPARLADELRAFARGHGVTPYTALLAAFAVLLARYSGQSEVVIGAPVSLRTLPEPTRRSRENEENMRERGALEPLIGMFVSSVVLRVRLDGDPTFAELIERVRATTTGAYAHQDLPLEHVVEVVRPERSPSYHPVFQVMFIHDDAPALGDVAGLSFEPFAWPVFDAKFDLMLSMAERSDGIHARWEYRRDLFDADTLRRATEHLQALVQAMVLAPRQRVLQAPMLAAAERRRMVLAWNDTVVAWPDARGLHQLFEDQVAWTPDAVAVRLGDASMTYRELSARSTQIARHLRGLGIGRGERVAVALRRTPDLLASLLGVLKTGAAYVPLDPGYPAARLAFMLGDAAPAALLTDGLEVPGAPQVRMVRLDEIAEHAVPPGRALDAEVRPRDPAYLMYTSGSSGQPKAAIISHAALANYLRWCVEAYDVARGTGAVVSTSIAFDATVTSLFSPLLAGRTVVLLPEAREIDELAALIASGEPLGPLKLTPAHIDALRAAVPAPAPGRVHAIVVGGEPLLGEHVAWCRAAAPEARIFNEYGPTETTVGCSIYEVPAGPAPAVIPIGRPIANTRLHVLDAHLAPVPVGVTGELYIGGAGLAEGYHARPELTAERFVDDPLSPAPGARLYRTGDLAAYLPDGNLRFLGRRDGQIKLRGFRIELAEIEAVLAQHPAVGQAAVVVQTGAAGHPRLVAFAVVSGAVSGVAAGAPPGEAELRMHLAALLPDHMVPSVIAIVADLPLTPNGKIDRAALAAAAPPESAPAPAPVATAEHTELIALWCDVLGLPSVAITDNFFALGGDSILGIQLVARARARGIHFTPRQLVEHQTIETLARVVQREARVAADQGPVTGEVALAPMQRWLFAHAPDPHHFNQSVMLEVSADCDVTALRRALSAVVEHHDALRARFTATGGAVVQTFEPPAELALARVDLSALPDGEQRAALTERAGALQAALRLDDGSLFAPTLFWLGSNAPAYLLLTTHHLVIDAVSWRIVLEDLARAYRQACADEPIQLPAKTSSLRAWTERLDRWATSPAAAAQREMWSQIEQAPSKPLQTDRPPCDDDNRAAYAVSETRTLSPEHTARLSEVAAAYNAGIDDVLLAALARTFTDPGDPGDRCALTVDVESHGRAELFDDIDLSRTVGWFTSVFPVQLALRDGCSPADALVAVKEMMRGVPDLGVGHSALRYRDGGAGRRRAISFNYLGQLDRALPAQAGLALAATSCEPAKDPAWVRPHLLEINAAILGGALSIEWTYSERLFARATIAALAARFAAALDELVRDCAGRDGRHYTPSDFPDVALSQGELDDLVAELSHAAMEA
jgi:amino acid adenylation domain-containing protein/non-ribosomal peptide synthase protein (TIGR01720 family)